MDGNFRTLIDLQSGEEEKLLVDDSTEQGTTNVRTKNGSNFKKSGMRHYFSLKKSIFLFCSIFAVFMFMVISSDYLRLLSYNNNGLVNMKRLYLNYVHVSANTTNSEQTVYSKVDTLYSSKTSQGTTEILKGNPNIENMFSYIRSFSDFREFQAIYISRKNTME